jgi:hypothetical protein
MSVEASNGTPTSSDDAALIAEIAPAMKEKLRRDGYGRGLAIGLQVLFLTMLVSRQIGDMESIAHPMQFIVALSVMAIGVLVLLPLYMRKIGLSSELRYRRQHGKWRWDR